MSECACDALVLSALTGASHHNLIGHDIGSNEHRPPNSWSRKRRFVRLALTSMVSTQSAIVYGTELVAYPHRARTLSQLQNLGALMQRTLVVLALV